MMYFYTSGQDVRISRFFFQAALELLPSYSNVTLLLKCTHRLMDHCEFADLVKFWLESLVETKMLPEKCWDCQGPDLQTVGIFDLRTSVHVSALSYI